MINDYLSVRKLFHRSPVCLLIMFLGPGEVKEVNNDMIFLLRFINFAFHCHLSSESAPSHHLSLSNE